MAEGPAAVNLRKQLQSVHAGHFDVAEYNVDSKTVQQFQRVRSGVHFVHFQRKRFVLGKKLIQSIRDDRFIVNHQNTIHIILPLQCEAVPADCRRACGRGEGRFRVRSGSAAVGEC